MEYQKVFDNINTFVYDSGEYLALALTMKKLGPRHVQLSDYTEVLAKWKDKFNNNIMIDDFYTENDSNGKLHLHGVIYVKKNFYKKRLQTDGYYIYTTDIYMKQQWLDYCYKSQQLNVNLDNKQYMF